MLICSWCRWDHMEPIFDIIWCFSDHAS
jgi:hypothetical protein